MDYGDSVPKNLGVKRDVKKAFEFEEMAEKEIAHYCKKYPNISEKIHRTRLRLRSDIKSGLLDEKKSIPIWDVPAEDCSRYWDDIAVKDRGIDGEDLDGDSKKMFDLCEKDELPIYVFVDTVDGKVRIFLNLVKLRKRYYGE